MSNGDVIVFRDVFGRRWRLTIGGDGGDERSENPNPVARVRSLVFGALAEPVESASGPRTSESVALVLALFERLTGRELARELQRAVSPGALLSMWRSDIEATLVRAAERGAVRFDEIADEHHLLAEAEAPRTIRTPPPVADVLSSFSLLLVDEVGAPIDGIDIAFGVGVERKLVTTNGSGIARLDGVELGVLSAAVAKPETLRDKLKPRWAKARRPNVPKGPDVFVEQIDHAATSLSLEAEKQATLAITPLFRCNEIAGMHFAFARSFVLASAIDPLSLVADAIVEDENRRAMIFGHSDASGTEDENKALSEQRAKAIHAILTHDTGAWEDLWTGSEWGTREAQHLLNAFAVLDDDGDALVEDGVIGPCTKAALSRFQRGEYPNPRAARGPLSESGEVDAATREEFLLSFGDRVTTDPIPADRFTPIGGTPFMGCGEFNPLSEHACDAASRRTVVFVLDAAAAPQSLPCQLGSCGPCRGAGSVDSPPPEPGPDDKPLPYRCQIYRDVAKTCPCVEGEELMQLELMLHDRSYDPAPGTTYELIVGGTSIFGTTDGDGVLRAAVAKTETPLIVKFQPSTETVPIVMTALLTLPDDDETDRAYIQRIRNLGFGTNNDNDAYAIRKFQTAHKELERSGVLDDDTKKAVRDLDDASLSDSFVDEPEEESA